MFIFKKIKEFNLRHDKHPPIVAFGKSGADPHYHPPKEGSERIKKGSLVMIDIFAKLKKPKAPLCDVLA